VIFPRKLGENPKTLFGKRSAIFRDSFRALLRTAGGARP
jgi:hypothetical protein